MRPAIFLLARLAVGSCSLTLKNDPGVTSYSCIDLTHTFDAHTRYGPNKAVQAS